MPTPPPTHYADGAAVTLRLQNISEINLTEGLLEEGLTAADDIINGTVPGAPFTTPYPEQIVRAATYYAAMDIIDVIFTNMDGTRMPTALAYETRAKEVLVAFI